MYSVALLWKKELVVNFCIQFNLYSLVAVETNELYCTIYFVLSPVGLVDEQQKVRTITALALAALAEAATPYGIESFDSVLKPLWKGIRQHRGKVRLLELMFSYWYYMYMYMHQCNTVCISGYFRNGQIFRFLSETF